MLVMFMALNVVYAVVVLNYCCQCMLLTFYIEGLQEKIKHGEFKLVRGMQVHTTNDPKSCSFCKTI